MFVRGETGTIMLTVSNPTSGATDGSTTTVTQPLPAGLTLDRRERDGVDVHGHHDVTCTRNDVLAPGASFPPITIGVRVATTAGAVLTTAPRVTGRSGNVWIDNGSDRISTAAGVPGTSARPCPPRWG